jgi:SynChlorMet cassette protein ScmD
MTAAADAKKVLDMTIESKPIANPQIVLREEFDDWAILFDPDTGDGYGLNPVSVFIWKLLDGSHTLDCILKRLGESFGDVPEDAADHLSEFIEELSRRGLVGYEIAEI